ncbi:30S ribosomal protein S17e [Candidatus Woesearchaeota archaeon]|nr:30S ribosomal protein S17e [Candidatus Woesearchaeota archaeon]
MGRIKTTLVKRASNKILKENPDKFKKDFDSNKRIVEQYLDIPSKKLRNVIAGYVTRLANKEKK